MLPTVRLHSSVGITLLLTLGGCPGDDGTATTVAATSTTAASAQTSSTGPLDDSSAGTIAQPSDDSDSGDSGSGDSGSGDSGSGDSSSSGSGGTTGGGASTCGDGKIEGQEQCDCGLDDGGTPLPCTPAGLGGMECPGLVNPASPDTIYTGGILLCNPASCQFSFATCGFCGDDILDFPGEACEFGDDPNVTCQELGMGGGTAPLPCGRDCQIDTTCCAEPLPKECG